MVIISNLKDIIEHLSYSLQFSGQNNSNSRVAGILLAQPNNYTKDDILSGIDYFHFRSGKTIDFFCIGYQTEDFGKNLPIVANVDGQNWFFNAKVFNTLRGEIEQITKWRYSGSVELVLFNSYLDDESNEVKLDFSDALSIDLKKAKDDKLISSAGQVFEQVISIAEKIETDNPSKEISMKLIGITGKKSLVNILFNLLPQSIQNDTRKLYIYGTENYNR